GERGVSASAEMFQTLLAFPIKVTFLTFSLVYIICKLKRKYSIWSSKAHMLKGKVALITGGSSGLGEALAHALYKCGCKVIIAARSIDELHRVKRELLDSNCDNAFEPKILSLDLQDLQNIPAKAKEAIEMYGPIDILINNAGVSNRGTVEGTDVDVYQRVMTVNFFGQIALTKEIMIPMIEKKSGHIVVISSVQGKMSIPFRSAYSASKHALQAFFDSLRAELSGKGINVCVISPGYINTSLSVNALTGSGSKYGILDKNTASGMDPFTVANYIVDCIVAKEEEVVIAPSYVKLAIILRTLLPDIYFKIMSKRAEKGYKEMKKE
ncbi:dehydrogenase/reductase SDR family protein 7-like protein, partial [Dinothrombium tinctorium]